MRKPWLIILSTAILWAVALYFNQTQPNGEAEVGRKSVGVGAGQKEQTEELPRVGYKAPVFELKGLDGKTHSLKEVQGKPVIVNFWASWCGPCKMEAPMLERYYERYQGKVEIYAVNLTSNDSIRDAKAFADKYHFSFPVLLDMDGMVGSLYHVQAIPTSYFINKNGVIVDQILGLADPKSLNEKFQKVLTSE